MMLSQVDEYSKIAARDNEDSTKDQYVTLTEIVETTNFMRNRIKNMKMRIKEKERMIMNRIDNSQLMDEMRRELVEELLRQCAISKDSSSATNFVVMETFEHEQGIADDMAMGIRGKDGDGRWLISYLFWQTLCRLQQRREELAETIASFNKFQRQCWELKRKDGKIEDPESPISEPMCKTSIQQEYPNWQMGQHKLKVGQPGIFCKSR